MKAMRLLDNLQFATEGPHADYFVTDQIGKIVRYTLRPGQCIEERNAPYSPVYILVLKGEGVFQSENETEQRHGPGSLIVFVEKEDYLIRADDNDLVFLAFLHWAPAA